MKSRFGPSPTGLMHMGNGRTALFNALCSLHERGIFLLRIEDTDKARSTNEFSEILQQDLHWLGLDWQEGPYFQSQRQPIYDEYYQRLEQAGWAYPCFCSEQQLAIARKVQLASGLPPRYSGTCLKLTAEEAKAKLTEGLQPTLRFRVPDNEIVSFSDFVRGEQVFKTQDIGDFIIRRADGTASFIFCNAIDDALMGVTHALRGEDHLTNTPRQLLILKALGLPSPAYGHISMIVGADGSPLSKRHGSRSIKELREEGYFPIALNNYMARLGHYYENNQLMTLEELAAGFSITSLGAAPARYDAHQLLHWQKEAVQKATADELWNWMGSEVHAIVPPTHKELFIATIRANITFPSDAYKWAEIFFRKELIYSGEIKAVIKEAGALFFARGIEALEQGLDYSGLCRCIQEHVQVKGKALFLPLRAALSGQTTGTEMAPMLLLMGHEMAIERFKQALTSIKNG